MKKLSFVLVLVLVLLLVCGLVACNKDKGPEVPEYIVPTIGASYGQTLADLALPEGFSWEEGLDTLVGDVGDHVFHLTYTPEDTSKFKTITGIEVTITVTKGTPQPSTIATLNAVYGQTLANVGLPEVSGGIIAWQEPATTSVGNAGSNVFHVVFTPTDSEHYNIVRDIPVTVQVAKAEYDMTGVVLNGGQFTYDGTAKSLAISGTLPEGVTVSYEGNGKVNAGTYEVIAHFTGDANHNAPADLRANLIILKADIQGLSFLDSTVTYDGQPHSLAVAGTDSSMTVQYDVTNSYTNFGTYEVYATISKENYNNVVLHAVLRINKATLNVVFNNATYTYDGTAKSLAISGTLPDGVTVEYTGNGQIDAGTYVVTAHFTVNGNYNDIEDKPAQLKINKAIPEYEDLLPTETIVMDLSDENTYKRYFGPAVAPTGFSPQMPGGHYVTPDLGINYIYVDYVPQDTDNYEIVTEIPIKVLAWDSSLYTIKGETSLQVVIYDSDENVTIRFVDPSGGPYDFGTFSSAINNGEIFAYIYEGEYPVNSDFLDDQDKAIVPDDVYSMDHNDFGYTEIEEYIMDWLTDTGRYSVKYIVYFSETTLEPYFLNVGDVEYIYNTCDYDGNGTYSFNISGPEYLVYYFDGTYDKDTLPAYGTLVGEWDTRTVSGDTTVYFVGGAEFVVGNDGQLSRAVGEKVYTYQFADHNKNFTGENYVVWSFNIFDDYRIMFTYFFDEEVDLDTIDLSEYEPSLEYSHDFWEALTELGASEPSVVRTDLDWHEQFHFFITDDGLEPEYDCCYFEYFWYDSPVNSGTYYFDCETSFIFSDELYNNKVGEWYWNDEDGLVYARVSGGTFTFVPSLDNLGTLKLNIGEIIGVYDGGTQDFFQGWIALTSKGVANYITAAADNEEEKEIMYQKVLAGDIEPMLMTYAYITTKWKFENGYYLVSMGDATYLVLSLDSSTKRLSIYEGDVIYETEVYEGRDGSNNLVYAYYYTFNDILGHHIAYEWNAVIVNGQIIEWSLSESGLYSWDINERSGLLIKYDYEGTWYPYDSYYVPETGNVVSETPFMVYMYDYLYNTYEETGTIKYETWIVVLARDREHDSNLAFIFKYPGLLEQDKIPTFEFLASLTSPEDITAAGIIECLTPNDVDYSYTYDQWQGFNDYYEYVNLTVGINTYELFPISKNSGFITIPLVYEPGFTIPMGEGYTFALFTNLYNNLSNIQIMCMGEFEIDEIRHVINYGVNPENAWTVITVGEDQYIGFHNFGSEYIYDLYEIKDDELEKVMPEIRFTVEDNGETWLFCSLNDIAYPVFALDGTSLSEQAIEEAFENWDMELIGAWITHTMGNTAYVQFLTENYITGADKDDYYVYVVNETALVEPQNDFYGEVKAVLNCGGDFENYTYVLVKYFDEWMICYCEGTFNVAETQTKLDNGMLTVANPSVVTMIGQGLAIIEGELFDVSLGTFEEAESDICYWFSYSGRLYLLLTSNDVNIFVEARGDNGAPIDTIPASIDDITYTYLGEYMGTWYYSMDPYCDILQYDPIYGETYPFNIVDEVTGQVDFAAMP